MYPPAPRPPYAECPVRAGYQKSVSPLSPLSEERFAARRMADGAGQRARLPRAGNRAGSPVNTVRKPGDAGSSPTAGTRWLGMDAAVSRIRSTSPRRHATPLSVVPQKTEHFRLCRCCGRVLTGQTSGSHIDTQPITGAVNELSQEAALSPSWRAGLFKAAPGPVRTRRGQGPQSQLYNRPDSRGLRQRRRRISIALADQ